MGRALFSLNAYCRAMVTLSDETGVHLMGLLSHSYVKSLLCAGTNRIWETWHVHCLHIVVLTFVVFRCWIVCLTSWHLVLWNAVMSAKVVSLCSVQVWGIIAREIWQSGQSAKIRHLNQRESLSECLLNSHLIMNSCKYLPVCKIVYTGIEHC